MCTSNRWLDGDLGWATLYIYVYTSKIHIHTFPYAKTCYTNSHYITLHSINLQHFGYNTIRHNALHYSTVQHIALHCIASLFCFKWHCIAALPYVHYNTVQCSASALHCSALHCIAYIALDYILHCIALYIIWILHYITSHYVPWCYMTFPYTHDNSRHRKNQNTLAIFRMLGPWCRTPS